MNPKGATPNPDARPGGNSSSAQAPSVMGQLLPAVTEPEAGSNNGFNFARALIDWLARGLVSRAIS